MPNAIETLKSEHRVIEQVLRALEGVCTRLSRGENVAHEDLSSAVEFIRTFADSHHHEKEETLLFPALEANGFPRQAGPIAVMLHEHEIGRAIVRGLADASEEYKNEIPDARSRVVERARQFVELLRGHIYKEDNVLFEMAASVLAGEQMDELSAKFDEVVLAFGDERARFIQLATDLESRYAI